MARGKKTGGRRPGSLNKRTIAVKEALTQAFDGIGGLSAFIEWARENQTEFYKQYTKMLPTEIKNADGSPFFVKVLDMRDDPEDGRTE